MTTRWLDLDGAANVRDLGGLPLVGGGTTRAGRVLRADSLQHLTERDVRHLVEGWGLHTVVDLRTGVEVRGEGPGPLRAAGLVHHHLSLYPEAGETTDATHDGDGDGEQLPWIQRDATGERSFEPAVDHYLAYLRQAPGAVVEALRVLSRSDREPAVVHCAAGKDRTGTIVALALDVAGVERDAIAADYALTGERLAGVFAHLAASTTYARDFAESAASDPARHLPRAESMRRLLEVLDERAGGTVAWLAGHGFGESDVAALRAALRG